MSSQTTSRRRSRQAALQVLYALDIVTAKGSVAPVDEALDVACTHFELPEGAKAFAKELVNGVEHHREQIDALIQEHSTHWRLERMAIVDRNVLRIGVYECCFAGVPTQIAIDEALELARRFGDDPSPRFVNGVLDAVAAVAAEPQ